MSEQVVVDNSIEKRCGPPGGSQEVLFWGGPRHRQSWPVLLSAINAPSGKLRIGILDGSILDRSKPIEAKFYDYTLRRFDGGLFYILDGLEVDNFSDAFYIRNACGHVDWKNLRADQLQQELWDNRNRNPETYDARCSRTYYRDRAVYWNSKGRDDIDELAEDARRMNERPKMIAPLSLEKIKAQWQDDRLKLNIIVTCVNGLITKLYQPRQVIEDDPAMVEFIEAVDKTMTEMCCDLRSLCAKHKIDSMKTIIKFSMKWQTLRRLHPDPIKSALHFADRDFFSEKFCERYMIRTLKRLQARIK